MTWCIANFEVKHGGNGSRKLINVFHKCVLELNFATINGLGEPSCKSLYPTVLYSTYIVYCIGIGAIHYIS
jgi:hypothetical protein